MMKDGSQGVMPKVSPIAYLRFGREIEGKKER